MSDLHGLRLLYAEDESDLRRRIRIMLEMDGVSVTEASNGEQAIKCLKKMNPGPDLILSDIRMPVMDGLKLAEHARSLFPQMPIVLCTAFSETEYLVKAIKLGINGFVGKPVDYKSLTTEMMRVTESIRQQSRIALLEQEANRSFSRLIGGSFRMKQVAQHVRKIANTDYPVLIQGETGSGKSHMARLIHDIGPRAAEPFVTVHLGGIPESMAEAELFGHTKGAFTGATTSRPGLFRQANGGTIFLDDLDTGSLAIQSKILHVLDTHQIMPLGAGQPDSVDVRIIAASNKDLKKAVADQQFRQDLYYRIESLAITLPPLRERIDDIVPLASAFLADACAELKRSTPSHDQSFEAMLRRHPWPGNLRELKSFTQRLAVFAGEMLTEQSTLPFIENTDGVVASIAERSLKHESTEPLLTLEQAEARAMKAALVASGGRRMEAAKLLSIDYQRFRRLLQKHRLDVR